MEACWLFTLVRNNRTSPHAHMYPGARHAQFDCTLSHHLQFAPWQLHVTFPFRSSPPYLSRHPPLFLTGACCAYLMTPSRCASRYTEAADFHDFPESQIKSALVRATFPRLDFLAVECVLQKQKTTKSDIFSLAQVAICCYNDGKPLFESNGNVLTYQSSLEKLTRGEPSEMSKVPSVS